MKPFWFAFNTDAWLSSKSVRMMSLSERGAYIGLLATAWGEDQPGTLPAAEDFIRRLSEMSPDEWKVSGPVILAMFPLSECGGYRYNPRLLEEAGKREVLSEKKADAGRRSAAKRAAASTDGQQTGNTIPTGVEINPTGVDQKGNQLQIQLQLQAKAVEKAAAPEALPAKSKAEIVSAQVAADGGATYTADTFTALNDPQTFANLMDYLGYAGINAERYRLDIRGTVKGKGMDAPASAFHTFIKSYMAREIKAGPLLAAPLPAYAAPVMPDNPIELWGTPNPDYDHRKYNQAAGQYTGSVQ